MSDEAQTDKADGPNIPECSSRKAPDQIIWDTDKWKYPHESVTKFDERPPDPDEWMRMWKSTTNLRMLLTLLHCGLDIRNVAGQPSLIPFYVRLADQSFRHELGNHPQDQLGAMAFKMLRNRLFKDGARSAGRDTSHVTIQHPDDIMAIMWFFRHIPSSPAPYNGRINNYQGLKDAEAADIRTFMNSFVRMHWDLLCKSAELQATNDMLKKNRGAVLETAYRMQMLDMHVDDCDVLHRSMSADDAAVLRWLVMSPFHNGRSKNSNTNDYLRAAAVSAIPGTAMDALLLATKIERYLEMYS